MLRMLIRYSCIYEALMSPALNGSSAIQHFKHSDVIKMRDNQFLHETIACICDMMSPHITL